ncbi:hypothetical protein [Pseudomonas sp. 210_17 TE3656]
MNDERGFVRSTSAHLDVPALLKQPLTELLAVSPDAATALQSLGIQTIFDLGCSRLFADARVVAFTKDELGPAAMHGLAPGDLLDDATRYDTLEALGTLPLKALRLLSGTQATKLSQALQVTTVRDFAQWPPYVAARQLVNGSFGGASMDRDALQEERLRPTFGEFPTERVYYTTLVMLQMNETAADGMKVLDGGISLDASLAQRNGFTKPAIGAQLTYSQSWYVQGITFGHLLHSLALAPGEATRIAIVDWSRRTRATSTEAISETEQLDSATSHARALSEVQNAVANEMQQGGSMSTSHAESSAYSAQASVGTGLLTSLWASGDVSGTTQGSTTDTTASSSSWSLGNRSVAASMTQNINDRTEQHSTSARNRRATAVREVSQSEHEQVSTRIVANYNHMHALTIQYYEIVQVYRVTTRLHRAERCLFIPIERIDFSAGKGDQFVERFRGALARAALNVRARELLLDEVSAVEVRATSARIVAPFAQADLLRAAVRLNAAAMMARPETLAAAGAAVAPATALCATAMMGVAGVRTWDRAELATASRFLARPIVRPGSDALFVPDDTELLAITFDQVVIDKLRLDRIDPQASDTDLTVHSGRVDLPAGVRMGDLDAIHASRTESSSGSGQMTLWCAHLGRRFSLPTIPIEVGTAVSRVVALRTDQADRRRELLAHLQANNAHYTQAILRSLDSATLVLLLADYTWNGRPVIDQVEPKPVTVAGNFLVLRAPLDDGEPSGVRVDGRELAWSKLLVQRGFDMGDEPDARVVPIPTNGVFAEAVLGRSNSAEKLEYTRFWNWQDSPIPLQPTEIAPVSTGSRATPEDLKPGQLGQPLLNIVNPTSLPDPAGLGAVLTAVSNGNMFRDMAGLAGTQALAGQTSQGTLDAATAAAQIASANMRAQMQKAVAMGQIAADLAKTAMGMPSSGGSNQSITAEAARVAHGEQRDAAGLTPGSAAGGGASPDIGGDDGSSGGGESADGTGVERAVFGGSSQGSSGQAAFERALWGPMGEPAGNLARDVLGYANDGTTGAGGGIGGAGGSSASTTVSPFSTKLYPTEMVPGTAHNTRLTNALQTVRNSLATAEEKKTLDEVAIFVAKLTPSGTMEFAGVREHEMLFSGSLLKVSLLYTSFELVARVNAVAPHITAGSAADFFAKVKSDFDPKIVGAIPKISAGPWRQVSFDKALTATANASGNFSVTMSPRHDQELRSIFNNQNQNEGAKGCMRRLGFSYVNGNMDAAGFFGVATETGIWMATDYMKDNPAEPGNWPSFHVPVAGGGSSSAACTCISMANLLTRIHRKELIDAAASQTMRDIYATGGSWLSVTGAGGPYSFTSTGAKVGHSDSPSANVETVKSEALYLKRTIDNVPFVCVWQNVPDTFAFKHIYKVVDEVIKNWP